jgi:hypothetical protein
MLESACRFHGYAAGVTEALGMLHTLRNQVTTFLFFISIVNWKCVSDTFNLPTNLVLMDN